MKEQVEIFSRIADSIEKDELTVEDQVQFIRAILRFYDDVQQVILENNDRTGAYSKIGAIKYKKFLIHDLHVNNTVAGFIREYVEDINEIICVIEKDELTYLHWSVLNHIICRFYYGIVPRICGINPDVAREIMGNIHSLSDATLGGKWNATLGKMCGIGWAELNLNEMR